MWTSENDNNFLVTPLTNVTERNWIVAGAEYLSKIKSQRDYKILKNIVSWISETNSAKVEETFSIYVVAGRLGPGD